MLKLESFTHSIVVGDNASVYTLHKQGFPDFSFTAVNKTDFLRWQCAFLCSLRYSRNPDVTFNVNTLLSDIVAAADHARKTKEQPPVTTRRDSTCRSGKDGRVMTGDKSARVKTAPSNQKSVKFADQVKGMKMSSKEKV